MVYVIAPYTEQAVNYIPPVPTELLALLMVFLFAADLTLTVSALYHFDRLVIRLEDEFNHSMEQLVDNTVQQSNRMKQELREKGHAVNEQINMLGGFVKGTIRRASGIRYQDREMARTGMHLHARMKKIAKSIRSLEKEL